MTKQQILEALESLKELTNDNGKRAIDGIKAAVYFLREESEVPRAEKDIPIITDVRVRRVGVNVEAPLEEKTLIEPLPEAESPASHVPEVFHTLNTVKKKKKGTK